MRTNKMWKSVHQLGMGLESKFNFLPASCVVQSHNIITCNNNV